MNIRRNLFGSPVSQRGQILGCDSCPLDRIRGVRKIKGLVNIKGRRAMIWSQFPGGIENEEGKELVGPAGKFLWEALKEHGLTRDMFDIQSVVRCQPLSSDGSEHLPTKQELLSCSIYNDEALQLNHGNAKVHIILGDIAGEQLLKDSYSKEDPIFWYPPWDAYVVVNHHPSFILRKGGSKAGWSYKTWAERFRAVKYILEHPGQNGYVKSLNYKAVTTLEEFHEMEKVLRSEMKRNRRCSVDVEDDVIDNKRVMLLAGFGVGHFLDPKDFNTWSGQSWAVVLDHPEAKHKSGELEILKSNVKRLVEDVSIKKTLQNGSYDEDSFWQILKARLRGYDYDTRYGTYLRHSFLRSCSLENLKYLFFPEFTDYKRMTSGVDHHLSRIPLEDLVIYNCADTSLTQRLEQRFSPQVSQALVRVYIHAGITLDRMENRGPALDYDAWKKAGSILPKMISKIERTLQRVSGDPNFELDKTEQVKRLVYDTLGLPEDDDTGRSTNKLVLEKLLAETGNQTLDLIMKGRAIKRMKSTYHVGYKRSADMHGGEVRTRWFLTGAATGRLRSGGDGVPGFVNMQNLHGNPLIQNMLVSDPGWQKILHCDPTKLTDELLDTEVILAADGSQIELRALAELSNDPILIRQFQDAAKDRNNPLKDVHCQVGHMMTGWTLERIKDDKKTRRVCKNVHFGIAFGLSEVSVYPYVVAKMRAVDGPDCDLSDITPDRMVALHRKYFKIYKGVKRFIRDQRIKAESQGFVETLFGFRREILQDDEGRSTYWGNQAINSPVQGTAHQFILIALALLHIKPKTYNFLQKCIAEVHDALYFKVKLRNIVEAYHQLNQLFEVDAYAYAQREFRLKLRVPILSEAEAGMCMGSMTSYQGESIPEFITMWQKKHNDVVAKAKWEDLLPTSLVA